MKVLRDLARDHAPEIRYHPRNLDVEASKIVTSFHHSTVIVVDSKRYFTHGVPQGNSQGNPPVPIVVYSIDLV